MSAQGTDEAVVLEEAMRHRLSRAPVLPPGTGYLLTALSDECLSIRQVAAEVEKFPTVAARLLALSNSSWSSPVTPIATVEDACMRLGMNVVRTVSIGLAVSQPFNATACPGFDPYRYWVSAFLGADLAYQVAQHFSEVDAGAARTCGLLANIGLAWLADAEPRATSRALKQAADHPGSDVNDYLRDEVQMGYDEAGGLLTRHWGLPLVMSDAIAGQCSPVEPDPAAGLSRVLRASCALVHAVEHRAPPEPGDRGLAGSPLSSVELGGLYDYAVGVQDGFVRLARVFAGGAR